MGWDGFIDGMCASLLAEWIGLDAMLDDLRNPEKITTTAKSSMDWEKYKEDNELQEELEGATERGYIDRGEFLERTDHRQFEIERGDREKERWRREADEARAKR